MPEWSGVLNTTIRNFIRVVEQNILRNRKLLALLKSKNRITYNWSGEQMEWRVRYKRHSMQGMADSDTLTFARTNLFKKANLDWRGYASTDSVTRKEKEMNKSTEAIINRYSETAKLLLEDIEENFGDEFYIDGNASGNEKRYHGIESFMGNTGSAIVGTPVMNPDDSYAGLDTDLGAGGGSWATTWPKGRGSAEYDYWSPLILDVTSTLAAGSGGWSSSTATWAARALEIVRFGLIHSMKNKTLSGMIDTFLTEAEYYRQFLELLATKERVVVQTNAENKLKSLGFDDAVVYDGCEVTSEFGVPASVGYGFNTNNLELRSLMAQLFVPDGPDFDIASQSYRFAISNYGNLVFNPRYYFKIASFGTSGA